MVIDLYKFYNDVRKKIGRDAMYIICDTFSVSKAEVLSAKKVDVSSEDYNKANKLISRRENKEPLQYLIGKCEFYDNTYKVGKGVLIPRADTEISLETALNLCEDNMRVADLCSGSGCIALSLKKANQSLEVFAYELFDDALYYLKENAKDIGADINIIKGDVTTKLTSIQFDIVISNPPYLTNEDMCSLQEEVRYEPKTALYGGKDGLDFYKKITQIWKDNIKENGYLIFEVGQNQHEAVKEIMQENGFCEIEFIKDLSKIIRTVKGKRRKN